MCQFQWGNLREHLLMDNMNQQFDVLVVNYGISNTIVLEIP